MIPGGLVMPNQVRAWTMRSMSEARRPTQCALALTAAGLLALAGPASAAVPFKDPGASGGPLNHVQVGNELGCQAQHTGDTVFELYPDDTSPGDGRTVPA